MARDFTSNPAWLDALEANDPDVLVLCVITLLDGTLHKFTSQGHTIADATPSLSGGSTVPQQLDHFSRETSTSEITLEFVDDGLMRDLASTEILKGARVTLSFGDLSLVEADLELVFENLIVDDVNPDRGLIELVVNDPGLFALDEEILLYRHPAHPLAIARDDLETALPAPWVDSPTFDELDASLAAIGHHVACRQIFGFESTARDWLKVKDSVETNKELKRTAPIQMRATGPVTVSKSRAPIRDGVQGIANLLRSTIFVNEDGEFQFSFFDRTAAAVRSLDVNEVADFEQLGTFVDIFNDIVINGYGAWDMNVPYFNGEQAQSKIDFGTKPVGTPAVPRIYGESLFNRWIQSFRRLEQVNFGLSSTALQIQNPLYHGFVGTYQTDPTGTPVFPPSVVQQAQHQLNGTTRVGWFRITDHKPGKGIGGVNKREIVRATSFAFDNQPWDIGVIDSSLGARNYWKFGTYTVERANTIGAPDNQGTSNEDWTQGVTGTTAGRTFFVYDFTMAKYFVDTVLDRHARGVPTVQFTVPLRHDDLQLADFITVDSNVFLAESIDGADSSTIFEIVAKEPGIFDDSPGIRLTCVFVRDGAAGPVLPVLPILPQDPVTMEPLDESFLLARVGSVIHDVHAADGTKVRHS